MQLYQIGPAKGAQRLGHARDAENVRSRMQRDSSGALELQTWEMDTGRAMLIQRLIKVRLSKFFTGDGWFNTSAKDLTKAIQDALGDTSAKSIELLATGVDGPHVAAAMQHLRTMVFETTQEMMGAIAGRSHAIVSRWEAGQVPPGLDELLRLRSYALALELPWNDAILLDPGYLAAQSAPIP
jgi:hypothetical protein